MKPDLKTKKDKNIYALMREWDKLRDITRDAPLVPLEKPYQNGWIKYFVLRDDYTRRADAHVFKAILKEIGTEVFCRKVDFLDHQGQPYGPGLRVVGRNEWEMLGWTPQFKKHFSFGWHRRENVFFGLRWADEHFVEGKIQGYRMSKPFFLVEAIKPHFVTHTKTIYPEIETRMAEIKSQFQHKQLWPRYDKLHGRRWKGSWDYRLAKSEYLETLGTKEIERYCRYGEE